MTPQLAIILGGQRCGSTWLLELLNRHPQVCIQNPIKPEPKIFLQDTAPNIAEYIHAYFPHYIENTHKTIIEKSTSYFNHPKVLGRVLAVNPDAKFLIILRNPIDRAISHYYFSQNNGYEKRPILEAMAHETGVIPLGVSSPVDVYISGGFYHLALQKFYSSGLLHTDNFKVIILEELLLSKDKVAALFNWLNLSLNEMDAVLGPSTPVNAGNYTKESLALVRDKCYQLLSDSIAQTEVLLQKKLDLWYKPS